MKGARDDKRRLRPETREALIVAEATRLFAEQGFEASTSELAERMGVTQPLLYRYFPTKDALIERVYDSVYPTEKLMWEWEQILSNPEAPPRRRLVDFYSNWACGDWVGPFMRLLTWAQLTRPGLVAHYHDVTEKRIIPLVWAAACECCGERGKARLSAFDRDRVHALHGMMRSLRSDELERRGRPQGPARMRREIMLRLDIFLVGLAPTFESAGP